MFYDITFLNNSLLDLWSRIRFDYVSIKKYCAIIIDIKINTLQKKKNKIFTRKSEFHRKF